MKTGLMIYSFSAVLFLLPPVFPVEQIRIQKSVGNNSDETRSQSSPLYGIEEKVSPSADLQETKENYIVTVDLPGMDKEKIRIELRYNVLAISGSRERLHEEKPGDKIIRQELSRGEFYRSFTLPGPVESDKTKAKYENGVLTVILIKSRDAAEKKEIPIT